MKFFFETAVASKDGSIPSGLILKLKDYSFEALVFGQLLAKLIKHTLTDKEKYHLCLAGMIEALGDYICDDTSTDDARVLSILKSPEQIEPLNDSEKLFIDIYRKLTDDLNESTRELFYQSLLEGFEAQKRSRILKTPGLNANEVMQIQNEVGGTGLWVFRTLLGKAVIDNEKKAIYTLGGLVQSLDDIFDLKWDFKAKIKTSASVHISWQSLSSQLNAYYENTDQQFRKTAFDKASKKDFLFTFFLFTLGGNSYINNMNLITKGVLNAQVFDMLSSKEIKFRYLTWKNVRYIIPRLKQFNKYS